MSPLFCTCGKEKIYPSYEYAKGWILGLEEYCTQLQASKTHTKGTQQTRHMVQIQLVFMSTERKQRW